MLQGTPGGRCRHWTKCLHARGRGEPSNTHLRVRGSLNSAPVRCWGLAFTVSRIPIGEAACTTYAGYGPLLHLKPVRGRLFRAWVSSAVWEVVNMACGALWSRVPACAMALLLS